LAGILLKEPLKNSGFQPKNLQCGKIKNLHEASLKRPNAGRFSASSASKNAQIASKASGQDFAGLDVLSGKAPDAKSEPLDNRGNPFTPPEPKDEQKHRLSKAVRKILHAHGVRRSIRACGLPGKDTAHISLRPVAAQDGSTRLAVDGVTHCGSARCPHCAPLRASDVSVRVGAVLQAVHSNGYGAAFATWTMRHDRKTSLAEMRKAQTEAISAMQRGGLWNRLLSDGLIGFIRVFEVTWGPRTGWHLHVHAIVIHRDGAKAAVDAGQSLTGRWINLLAKAGHIAVGSGQKVVPVSEDKGLSDYGVADLRSWGMASEMAAGWKKTGKRPNRLNVPELLALAAEGDELAGAKYAEAVEALSGQRLLVVGPRLKRILGLNFEDIADEQEPELEAQDEKPVGLLPVAVWKRAANHPVYDHAWIIRIAKKLAIIEGIEWCDVSLLIWHRVIGDVPPD